MPPGTPRGSSDSETEERKIQLIQSFRTITTMIRTLEPAYHANPSDAVDIPPDGVDDVRIMTALAILLVRENEVTAVLAGDPRIGQTLKILAAKQPTEPPRTHQLLALSNPFKNSAQSNTAEKLNIVSPPQVSEFDINNPLSKLRMDRQV